MSESTNSGLRATARQSSRPQRPWQHLEQMLEDVQVRELALGSGYIMTGQAPPRARPAVPAS